MRRMTELRTPFDAPEAAPLRNGHSISMRDLIAGRDAAYRWYLVAQRRIEDHPDAPESGI